MFRAHVLIIRRSNLHYTASGIITPIGVATQLQLTNVYHIISYHISYYISYHVISYRIPYHNHIISYHIISYIMYHIIYCITLYHIISYHISYNNQLDAQNFLFYNKFISCLYMFRAHVLIIRRSKLHYTASGIITLKQVSGLKLLKCNSINMST